MRSGWSGYGLLGEADDRVNASELPDGRQENLVVSFEVVDIESREEARSVLLFERVHPLDAGADPDAVAAAGVPPLHRAVGVRCADVGFGGANQSFEVACSRSGKFSE